MVLGSLEAYANGISGLITASIRFTLTIALLYAVWIGQSWAKWLTLALIALTLLLFAPSAITSRTFSMVLLAAFHAFIFYALAFDKSVQAFLQSQKDQGQSQ